MKKIRRDCKRSEEGPKAEAREAERVVQAPEDAPVTTKVGALRPWLAWLQPSVLMNFPCRALGVAAILACLRSADFSNFHKKCFHCKSNTFVVKFQLQHQSI